MSGIMDDLAALPGVNITTLKSAKVLRTQQVEERLMGADVDEDGPVAFNDTPAPARKASVQEILASCSVQDLIRALSDAIRKEGHEYSVRVVPDAGLPFRLIAPFYSLNDTAVTFWLRRGTYEPFKVQDDQGQVIPLTLEFVGKRAKGMYAGGSTTLPGLDYDMVSFLIDTISDLEPVAASV